MCDIICTYVMQNATPVFRSTGYYQKTVKQVTIDTKLYCNILICLRMQVTTYHLECDFLQLIP